MDALIHCASRLSLGDLSNMAQTCKYFQQVAYSDSIWQSLFRERWSPPIPCSAFPTSSVREIYTARHTAVQQLKFADPIVADFPTTYFRSPNLVLLDKNELVYTQGSSISRVKIDGILNGRECIVRHYDHHASITCMRLFSLNGKPFYQNDMQGSNTILVTSSLDHTIRLWWKGSRSRCFRGHNGEVTTLSDKLLGNGNGTLFASGGIDGTVRLWSLNPSGRQGHQALKATLYGHEKPVVLMSIADHNSSLLASISMDSKVRIWDATTSSAARSSCCVGMTSVCGAPVGMKVHESLLYVAAGSSVTSIDLRTIKQVFTVTKRSQLYSFDFLPSKFLICTGGTGSAMLWDIRTSGTRARPIAELDGHAGPVKLLQMDAYKVVTGGPNDSNVNVWEAETGEFVNLLKCCPIDIDSRFGCSAMAVQGCRMVTAGSGGDVGLVRFWDFNNAFCNISSPPSSTPAGKFWGELCYSDFEGPDD